MAPIPDGGSWYAEKKRSNEVRNSDLRRVASAVATLPNADMPDSASQGARNPTSPGCSVTNRIASSRAIEEWERCICENKAVAILNRMQEGKTVLIKKDGGEMLIAIVLDKPLAEAQALVDDYASN